MSAFHLRPVDNDSTPSPTSSSTPPGDHSPRYNKSSAHHRPPTPTGRSRRPLSPSSLRDVDLTQSSDMQSRSRFPAPPTGHELMALFPAPAPECGPEARGGPTSGFFQRQERAFFAQAGKEIIRVRLEVDIPSGGAEADPKGKPGSSSRSWAQMPGQPGPHQSPLQPSAAPPPPQLFPHSNSRPPQRGSVPVTPLFSITSHPPPPPQHPPNPHPPIPHQPSPGLRTPPQDPTQSGPPPPRPDYHDEYDDESWKRPMPCAERRRAGKHTKRVIVR